MVSLDSTSRVIVFPVRVLTKLQRAVNACLMAAGYCAGRTYICTIRISLIRKFQPKIYCAK